MLTAPVAMADTPPWLNIADQSLLISVNSSLAAAMALAVALGPGGGVPTGAAAQLLAQARLAVTVVSRAKETFSRTLSSSSTVPSAALSLADTSLLLLPSLIESMLADAPSASTTQRVLAPATTPLQPRSPFLAICDTAVSNTASFCSSAPAAVATVAAATALGLKPSNWVTVDSACAALAAVTPPLALAAAATAISLNGVMLALAVTLPALAGSTSARIAKPAGSACGVPLTSSAWVVLPSALALTLTT